MLGGMGWQHEWCKIAPVLGLWILQHMALPTFSENPTMQPTTSFELEGKPGSTVAKQTFSQKLKRSMTLMLTETPVRAVKGTLLSESSHRWLMTKQTHIKQSNQASGGAPVMSMTVLATCLMN